MVRPSPQNSHPTDLRLVNSRYWIGVSHVNAQSKCKANLKEPTTPTYVVECYWPDISEHQATAALAGIGRSQEGVNPTDRVWPLGCILVPSDGLALFLIAGPSTDVIRDVGELVQLPFDRIVESISIAAVTTPAVYVQQPCEGE